MKKILYILAIIIILAGLSINRARQISKENAREIFNIARAEKTGGVPVETMTARTEKGILNTPVTVRNRRILVSSNRVRDFKPGQRISGGGRIISVSRNVDLDTGLFVINTNSPAGNFFAEIEYTGVFVPLSAISGSSVMIAKDGIAVEKQITIVSRDIERAVVRGLSDGDVIILTSVEPETKIRPVIQR